MKKILKVEQIQKYYGNKDNITKAIDGISFEVEEGEFIGIMGASGSGKTTLLNCISTIDNVSAGHIYLENQDITEIKEENIAKFRRENLGFIFQDFNLLDTLTIEENIALILTINKVPEKEIDKRILEIAKKLGMDELQMNRTIFKQLFFYFAIPMLIPVLVSIPAILSIGSLFAIAVTMEEIIRNMFIILGMLILVYGIYFIATDVQFDRNINGSR